MIFTGQGQVWDAENGNVLCRFDSNGVFKTEDERIIKRLKKLGYAEAKPADVVNIELCNSVNVDWKVKYELEHEALVALRVKYAELEEKLNDIETNTDIPVHTESLKTNEEEVNAVKEDNYILGDDVIPKDIESIRLFTLRKLLKEHDGLEGRDMRKLTKKDAVGLMYSLLDKKGLLK